jgi:hypothetical protein
MTQSIPWQNMLHGGAREAAEIASQNHTGTEWIDNDSCLVLPINVRDVRLHVGEVI